MTAKRRARRSRGGGAAVQQQPAQARAEGQAAGLPSQPQWKWKTFPVYFAAALALFVGVYVGYLAGYLQFEEDNATVGMVAFIVSAIFLGFGFSRLTTRLMMSRQWIKPRPRRR